MGSKTYGQNCGLARALDVLGERWTLLLIRELSWGPRRYKDLAEGLPGIGTNLLADRLKALEGAGVIEKILLPAPESVAVYSLTDAGIELVPLVGQLARWGLRHGAAFDHEAFRKTLRAFIEREVVPASRRHVPGGERRKLCGRR